MEKRDLVVNLDVFRVRKIHHPPYQNSFVTICKTAPSFVTPPSLDFVGVINERQWPPYSYVLKRCGKNKWFINLGDLYHHKTRCARLSTTMWLILFSDSEFIIPIWAKLIVILCIHVYRNLRNNVQFFVFYSRLTLLTLTYPFSTNFWEKQWLATPLIKRHFCICYILGWINLHVSKRLIYISDVSISLKTRQLFKTWVSSYSKLEVIYHNTGLFSSKKEDWLQFWKNQLFASNHFSPALILC